MAGSVRWKAVEQAIPISPRVKAAIDVTRKAAAIWSSSMPPNKNTRLKIGTDNNNSRRTKDMEASSLPHRIENEGNLVTNSRSIVCRSRSLLTAPAVSAGVMKASRTI